MRVLALLVVGGCVEVTEDGSPSGTETGDTGTTGPIDADGDGSPSDLDCDDADPYAFPGAPADCRALDADCDGTPEERATVPGDHVDPQAAIDAGEARRICVEPGTYGPIVVGDGAFEVGAAGADVIVDGGAVRAVTVGDGSLTLAGVTIRGTGGGLWVDGGVAVVRDVTFDAVSCACSGAAILAEDAELTVVGSRAGGTTVTGADVIGGVVFVDGGTATIDGLWIDGGSVAADGFVHGGALGVVGADVVASHLSVDGLVVSTDNVEGGALYLFSGELRVENAVVTTVSSTATDRVEGGAVAAAGSFSTLSVTNATFAGNSSAGVSCSGAGVQITSAVGELANTTVDDNPQTCATVTGGGVDVSGDGFSARHTNVSGHADGDWTGTPDPAGTAGNLSVAPGFVSADDLHLAPGSPLIDAGDPALLDPDGSPSDIGAFGGAGGAW